MHSNHLFNFLCIFLAVLGFVHASPQRNGNGNNTNNNDKNQKSTTTTTTSTVKASTTVSVSDTAKDNTTGKAGNTVKASTTATTSTTANASNKDNNNNKNNANSGTGATTLDAANIQDASASTGGANAEKGQSDSLTDTANFINFCTGKTITNGLQIRGGSCNGIVMGDIPSAGNMISSIIVSPGPGDNIAANTAFNIQVQVANLQAGTFTNPNTTYYAAPQQLSGGKVVGHTHVTVQNLGGSLAPTTPPDAGTFAFFKGINDDGNGNGLLSATVAGGLPAGNYRVCTMTSSSNHQPVLMPLAQRGAQDDCTKFTVGGTGGGNKNVNSNANGNGDANGSTSTTTKANGNTNANTKTTTKTNGKAIIQSSTTSSLSQSTSATSMEKSNRRHRGGQARHRFSSRDFEA